MEETFHVRDSPEIALRKYRARFVTTLGDLAVEAQPNFSGILSVGSSLFYNAYGGLNISEEVELRTPFFKRILGYPACESQRVLETNHLEAHFDRGLDIYVFDRRIEDCAIKIMKKFSEQEGLTSTFIFRNYR